MLIEKGLEVRKYHRMLNAGMALVCAATLLFSLWIYFLFAGGDQGSGRKLGSDAVLELHRILCGDLQPDLTILLDSDPGKSIGRARRRNRGVADKASKSARQHMDENRFERETRAFFGRVHEGYLAIAAREPQRVVKVDASGTPGQTHRRIVEVVRKKLRL